SWLLGEKILRMFVALIIGIWVARYLGPEDFGLFSYAQSFVGLFLAIATLGLDGIVIKELVNNPKRRDKVLGTAFILKLLGATLVLIMIGVSLIFNINDYQTTTLVFIIACTTIFQSFNVIDFYFQSQVLSRFVVYSNIISLLLSSLIKISLILLKAPLEAFAYVFLFDSFVLSCGLILFYYKNNLSIFHWAYSAKYMIVLLKNSWPLILSGLVVSLYMNIDQVMIKLLLTSEDVGQYAAAVRISEAWYFIPMVISASIFPAILNAKKNSDILYKQRLQKLYDLMAWLAIVIALPITFLAEDLITFLYGVKFNASAGVLVIHIWTGIFIFLGLASTKWFIAENLQKFLFYRAIIGATVNIVLNYIFIPKYGIQGAAISTLIAQFTASYLFNLTHKKLFMTFQIQSKALLLPFRKINKLYQSQ
ncbi:flippase, partial [Colwellia sp. E2M01]|uniref:flippase n=1 Tax=Colwellia sp. E2M01 TaxID=2841561 RepID=UPI001C09C4F8